MSSNLFYNHFHCRQHHTPAPRATQRSPTSPQCSGTCAVRTTGRKCRSSGGSTGPCRGPWRAARTGGRATRAGRPYSARTGRSILGPNIEGFIPSARQLATCPAAPRPVVPWMGQAGRLRGLSWETSRGGPTGRGMAGSSSMRGAEPWLQLLCFLIFINILYTLYPSFSFHRQRQSRQNSRGKSRGKWREVSGKNGGKVSGKNGGKVSGNFTGVLNSTYVGIPTQVMH